MIDLYSYVAEATSDLLVAGLWSRMRTDGDLDLCFSQPDFPLSSMLRLCAAPHECFYALDDSGVWFVIWLEPFATGTFLTCYVRPDHRGSIDAATCFARVLDHAVATYSTVLNITWQQRLLPIHYAMGYKLVGMIPKLLHGRDAFLLATSEGIRREVREASDLVDPTMLEACERRWTNARRSLQEHQDDSIAQLSRDR